MVYFKVNAKGSLMQWDICVRDNKLHITHGHTHGKIRTDIRDVVVNKSGRSIEEQCELEMNNRITKKLREGYTLDTVRQISCKPMLLQTYSKERYTNYPYMCQPKLDGVRILAFKDKILSRNGIQYTMLGHLDSDISALFDNLPDTVVFIDGELYSDDLPRDVISGIARSKLQVHPQTKDAKFFVFDIMMTTDVCFSDRNNYLVDAFKRKKYKTLELVKSTTVNSYDELMSLHCTNMKNKYEGTVVRDPAGLYEQKRSFCAAKLKDFMTKESIIVGVEEAKGTEKGTAMLVINDEAGNPISIRCQGSFEKRKTWLDDPSLVIGKLLEFKYFEVSKDGSYVHPVGIDIRDYE